MIRVTEKSKTVQLTIIKKESSNWIKMIIAYFFQCRILRQFDGTNL